MALLLFAFGATAQDLMVLRDGSIEKVKVLEVNGNGVRYRKHNNIDGPVFWDYKANILSIRYEDGSIQRFDAARGSGRPADGEKGEANRGLSVHIGCALPTGDFADDEEGFGAAKGLSIGVKQIFPIASQNLGLFISADIIHNGIKDNDELDDAEENGFDIQKPRCFNIPILAGFNYSHDIDRKTGIWAEAGAGINFRKITDAKMQFGTQYMKAEFQTGTSMAVQCGVGVMLHNFTVGLHYYSLGEAKIKLTNRYNFIDMLYDGGVVSGSEKSTERFKADVVMLRLGYRF